MGIAWTLRYCMFLSCHIPFLMGCDMIMWHDGHDSESNDDDDSDDDDDDDFNVINLLSAITQCIRF